MVLLMISLRQVMQEQQLGSQVTLTWVDLAAVEASVAV